MTTTLKKKLELPNWARVFVCLALLLSGGLSGEQDVAAQVISGEASTCSAYAVGALGGRACDSYLTKVHSIDNLSAPDLADDQDDDDGLCDLAHSTNLRVPPANQRLAGGTTIKRRFSNSPFPPRSPPAFHI